MQAQATPFGVRPASSFERIGSRAGIAKGKLLGNPSLFRRTLANPREFIGEFIGRDSGAPHRYTHFKPIQRYIPSTLDRAVVIQKMLEEVEIQNFRSCRETGIAGLGPIIALVGKNGAGKTNILQAILQTAVAATSTAPVMNALEGGSVVTLTFEAGNSQFRYTLANRITSGPEKPPRVSLEERLQVRTQDWEDLISREAGLVRLARRENPLPIGEFAAVLPSLATLLPAQDVLHRNIGLATNFLREIRYYPLDEPAVRQASLPISHANYAAWANAYESGGSPGESVLYRIIYMWLKRREDLEVIGQMLGANGIGLIDDISVQPLGDPKTKPEQSYYLVLFKPTGGPEDSQRLIPSEMLSTGTRRIIRLLISMLFDRASVMLVEQPEDSLHQGMTKKVIDLVRQNAGETQLILSSHSSALLNKLKPSHLRLVSMENGHTVARQLTQEELRVAEKFMNDDGPLYDFLSSIEGD